MDNNKQDQEVSIIGRLFSMQALLFVMGLFSLGSGIFTGELIQVFWGVMIIGGSVMLYFVRKKDWKKHWEEQERMAELYRLKEEERKQRESEKK